MKNAVKRFVCGGVAVGALAACALPAAAQEPIKPVQVPLVVAQPVMPVAPTYRVKMLKFRAADESGYDWLGSDEVYWVVSSVGADGTAATFKTRTFGDVDTGETRTFGASEGCAFPTTCGSAVAPDGIGMSIQLIEEDNGDAAAIVAKAASWFKKAGDLGDFADPTTWLLKAMGYMGTVADYISSWLEDDLLGSRTLTYSPSQLASRLPAPGRSYTETRYFGGLDTSGGADYYLTLRVTRVS